MAQAKLLVRIMLEPPPRRFHVNQTRSLDCLKADGLIVPGFDGWETTEKGLAAARYLRDHLTQRRTNNQESPT